MRFSEKLSWSLSKTTNLILQRLKNSEYKSSFEWIIISKRGSKTDHRNVCLNLNSDEKKLSSTVNAKHKEDVNESMINISLRPLPKKNKFVSLLCEKLNNSLMISNIYHAEYRDPEIYLSDIPVHFKPSHQRYTLFVTWPVTL